MEFMRSIPAVGTLLELVASALRDAVTSKTMERENSVAARRLVS
jgi:hypothetical protein